MVPAIKKYQTLCQRLIARTEYLHSFSHFLTRELFVITIGDGDKASSGNRGVAGGGGLMENDLYDKLRRQRSCTDLENQTDGIRRMRQSPK